MATYVIRDIDNDLWRKVKVKAASEGKSIRTVLLEFLMKYAK